jgi:hypothetical protein
MQGDCLCPTVLSTRSPGRIDVWPGFFGAIACRSRAVVGLNSVGFPPSWKEACGVRHDRGAGARVLRGYSDDPVSDIRLPNVDFQQTVRPCVVENVAGLVLEDVYENGGPMSG